VPEEFVAFCSICFPICKSASSLYILVIKNLLLENILVFDFLALSYKIVVAFHVVVLDKILTSVIAVSFPHGYC